MKKSITFSLSLLMIILLVKISGCEENNLREDDHSSFGLIQTKIFNASCAISGCHSSEKDPSFVQHKLVLSEGYAYRNLVDIESENEQARLDGLKRVKPGDSENSLLHHKLHCDDGHHSQDYGNMMPIGLDPLSQGQIDFITAWIDAGAPRNEVIDADPSLLDDNVSGCAENFTNLPTPAEDEGYQIKVDAFDVPPQFEREIFVYKEVGNQEEFFLTKVVMKMRRNSHHFLVANYRADTPPNVIPQVNAIRDLRNANGKLVQSTLEQMEYQAFTIASQTSDLEYEFPTGVALRIPAQYKLDMNLHYVNKSQKIIQGECSMNLYKVSPEQVVHEAKPVFFNNGSIVLPPNEKTIVIREFEVDAPMKIFMLTSHTHKLGERFEIQIMGGARNGELVYSSADWHHPVIKTFDVPVEIHVGEGLRMIVTFNNTTDKTVRYGLTSEDEMAIIYGYYY